MSEREQFETAYRQEFGKRWVCPQRQDMFKRETNRYAHLSVQDMWVMWQAARAQPAQAGQAGQVPMTEEQMMSAFAVAHPQYHADMQDGSHANAVERIGASNVYRRFERGIRAAERHHGIVGKEGGA